MKHWIAPLGLLAACVAPTTAPGSNPYAPATPIASAEVASATVEPPATPGWGQPTQLYGRDGRPVGKSAPLETRELQGGFETRPSILEEYQRAVADRDAYRAETGRLMKDLETLRAVVAAEKEARAAAEAHVVELIEESSALRAQNVELAAHLTQAQIGRLEAEKLLLKTKIQQAQTAEAAQANKAASEASKGPEGPVAATDLVQQVKP